MSKPWEDAPDLWPDERAYCQWLRSMGRKVWSRHPLKHRYIKMMKVPLSKVPVDERPLKLNVRTKELCRCEMCQLYKTPSQIEVDHIHEAGSFTNVEEWHDWMDRLLMVGFADMRVLCKSCHVLVNLSQRFHCSIEEAVIRHDLAQFKKLKVTDMRAKLKGLSLIVGNETKKACEEVYERYVRSDKPAQE